MLLLSRRRQSYLLLLFICMVVFIFTTIFRMDSEWPMIARMILFGSTELILHYRIDVQHPVKMLTVTDNLVMSEGCQGFELTNEHLVNLSDAQWKRPIAKQAYLVYDQPINLTETVEKLMSGKAIPVAPINNQPLRFRTLCKSVCHPHYPKSSEFDVIIVVKSGVANSEKRQNFRQIYKEIMKVNNAKILGCLRIGMVFTVGIPRIQENNLFERDNVTIRLMHGGGNFLNPESLERIGSDFTQETMQYNDLIVGDYEDTYFNLTLKLIHTYHWAAKFCRRYRPTFVFLDDDCKFDSVQLVQFFSSKSKNEVRTLFHGHVANWAPPVRFQDSIYDQWKVHKKEVPWPIYPPYCLGSFMIVGFDNLERIALGMLFTKQFHIDDAWLGVVSAKLGIINNPLNTII